MMDMLREASTGVIGLGIGFCSVLVVASGLRLAHYGDLLGERLGLSRTWVGVILFATITSLPELVVTLGSQLVVNRPGLVMGNVSGSNLFNLFLFALLDFQQGRGSFAALLDRRLIRSALIGLVAMSFALTGFLLPLTGNLNLAHYFSWPLSLLLLAVFIFSLRQNTPGGKGTPNKPVTRKLPPGALTTPVVVTRFFSYALLILLSGTVLILLCDSLIGRTIHIGKLNFSLGESVVGTLGLAVVTSLPEVVVCMASVRLGALDMAVGNIFGSNVFNMVLLPLAHFVRPMEPFWSRAEPVNAISLGSAMVLTCVIALAIHLRPGRSILRFGWDGYLVAVVGGGTFILVAWLGAGG
jgi:cation:H+ antiporter